MLTIRHANERGRFHNRWLDSQHSFSFGNYFDPAHMGVSMLRVINDDKVSPGAGFPTHAHNNMEIVSYVLDGELEHRDSMGNGGVIRPGDVQRMSAGTGVTHSEFNPSDQHGTNFLQIWLLPNARGVSPEYQQKHFAPQEKQGEMKLLVSPDGRNGSISIHSDTLLYGTLLDRGQSVNHELDTARVAYVHVARGRIKINGNALNAGDGATVSAEAVITLEGVDNAEALLFDMPATRH